MALEVENPLANAGDMSQGVQSLGWEDPLEEDTATLSSILAWRILGQRSLAGNSPWDHKRAGYNWSDLALT